MPSAADQLTQHVEPILKRFCRQNDLPELSDLETLQIGNRLWEVIRARGLPRPLAEGETGSPGELNAAEVTPVVEGLLQGSDRRATLMDAVRQLVKACFHREFVICRDSYREVSADGSCRRQTLKKALGRVSGSHCVDCPYWTNLSPAEHTATLGAAWLGDPAEFKTRCEVYLPEDFRALRRWLRAAARSGLAPVQH